MSTSRSPATRGPNKVKPITADRKLISRSEAANILGCHRDTLKKLEDRKGGPLKVRRLSPTSRTVFYLLEDVNALLEGASNQPAA